MLRFIALYFVPRSMDYMFDFSFDMIEPVNIVVRNDNIYGPCFSLLFTGKLQTNLDDFSTELIR